MKMHTWLMNSRESADGAVPKADTSAWVSSLPPATGSDSSAAPGATMLALEALALVSRLLSAAEADATIAQLDSRPSLPPFATDGAGADEAGWLAADAADEATAARSDSAE
jgi:hypothetical protein